MKYSFPPTVTSQIAFAAAQNAREGAMARGWKSSDAFSPIFGAGYFGVRTSKKYHMYQELGTKPFLMRSLEGKVVPLKQPDGSVHFIKVVGVGQPGWVNHPKFGRIWRDQKWRHPGIKPTHLMGDATKKALKDNRPLIVAMMRELIGEPGNLL